MQYISSPVKTPYHLSFNTFSCVLAVVQTDGKQLDLGFLLVGNACLAVYSKQNLFNKPPIFPFSALVVCFSIKYDNYIVIYFFNLDPLLKRKSHLLTSL